MVLGYGVNAYFDMLSSLSYMFVMITIFCLPIYYMYASHGAFSDYRSFSIAKYMLGNLGGSSVFCEQYHMNRGQYTISCPPESYIDTNNLIFGMISDEIVDKNVCTQKMVDILVKKNNQTDCTATLNKKVTLDRINKACSGEKTSCNFKLDGL